MTLLQESDKEFGSTLVTDTKTMFVKMMLSSNTRAIAKQVLIDVPNDYFAEGALREAIAQAVAQADAKSNPDSIIPVYAKADLLRVAFAQFDWPLILASARFAFGLTGPQLIGQAIGKGLRNE